jgi:hypothetical protein
MTKVVYNEGTRRFVLVADPSTVEAIVTKALRFVTEEKMRPRFAFWHAANAIGPNTPELREAEDQFYARLAMKSHGRAA